MPDDVIGHSPRLYSGCCVLVVDSNLRTCEVVGTQFRIEGFQSFFASAPAFIRAAQGRNRHGPCREPMLVIPGCGEAERDYVLLRKVLL